MTCSKALLVVLPALAASASWTVAGCRQSAPAAALLAERIAGRLTPDGAGQLSSSVVSWDEGKVLSLELGAWS